MIEAFEKAIASGVSLERLERIRDELKRSVETDRIHRLNLIEQDFKSSKLVLFGLQQPCGSVPYSVAKGFQRWFKKKYPVDEHDNLATEIMRELKRQIYEEQREKQKGATNNVQHTGKPSETSGEGVVERGAIGPEELFAGVPSAEPGESPRVEQKLLGTESIEDGPGSP